MSETPAKAKGSARERILGAAQELFGRHGYAGTPTIQIAQRAEVAEPTIFRQFGSKSGLFTAAVIVPFTDYCREFIDGLEKRERGVESAWQETLAFYTDLFALLTTHRGMIIAMVSIDAHEEPGLFPSIADEVAKAMAEIERAFEVESELRGFGGHAPTNLRFMVGLALSACVHNEWLFASGTDQSPEDLVVAATRFTLYGLSPSDGRHGDATE